MQLIYYLYLIDYAFMDCLTYLKCKFIHEFQISNKESADCKVHIGEIEFHSNKIIEKF